MIKPEISVSSEVVRQDVLHTLFVEGKENSIDPIALSDLLPNEIRVKPFGPSFYITAAAEALVKEHPNYYFLIDRDHHDDDFIQNCWDHFPDPDKANLLVWFRRELENYFIIPEYLLKSQYLVKSEDELRTLILNLCSERLFFDAANLVIIQIREELKENWIRLFTDVSEFNTEQNAINKLKDRQEFDQYKRKFSQLVGNKRLENRFSSVLDRITGGKEQIEYGCGKWLEMIKGKAVLPTVINLCFRVRDARGNSLQGRMRINEVVKDLVRKPFEKQPDDFKRLYNVINDRIAE
ncbi:MAG: hypothetical protein P9X24_03895 [Candidatus Hatepunaea meridiana]|nr:hypothetical protein [Candidatus Hatepunaea meridiana]